MKKRGLSYLPRLDGLRAVAVGGVLLEHFCPVSRITALSPGGAGVTLFFVLSGYLITRILLNYRQKSISTKSAAIHFYTRRFLRLSPPYYLAIAIAVLFGIAGMRTKWWIPALYLTNFHIAFQGIWPGNADHFWSLAVEEQFYLLWFVVVVALPSRLFVPSVVFAISTSFVFRLGVWSFSLSPLTTVLLLGHMATLATGALIAYAEIRPDYGYFRRIFLSRQVLILSLIAFLAVSVSLPYVVFPRVVLYPFSASIFFGCLVRQCAAQAPNIWLDWLSWRPLTHIGTISYGIYVYHLFIPRNAFLAIAGRSGWAMFCLLVAASIVVAELSYFVIERPVLRFKNRFTVTLLRGSVDVRPASESHPLMFKQTALCRDEQ